MNRLDEIQARVDAATAGPWTIAYYTDDRPCERCNGAAHISSIDDPENLEVLWLTYEHEDVGRPAAMTLMPEDLALVTAAREDLPYLLARVRELEAGLQLYADERMWRSDVLLAQLLVDRGETARAALAGES